MKTVIVNRQLKVQGELLEQCMETCRDAVASVMTSNYVDTMFKNLASSLIVHVSFVSPHRMKEVNYAFRNISKTTDVLSFPMLEMKDGRLLNNLLPQDVYTHNDGSEDIMIGDILVSFDKVNKQSEELGHSFLKELYFLVVHSTLHLIGYDHINTIDEKLMLSAQRDIMKRFKE